MEDEKLVPLKTLYDELWSDARTMIKDLNRSITSVFFFGIVMISLFFIELGTVVEMYARIASGSTRALDYFYLAATAFGSIVAPIAGILYLRFYFTLKNRYAKLIELEKTLEG